MNSWTYAGPKTGKREMVFNIANMTIGVGILTFPRTLAKNTLSIDGWISILIGGLSSFLIAWLIAKLAARFPKETFPDYIGRIATKPVAYVVTFSIIVYFISFVAHEVRALGNIATQYLFSTTPVEVITLVFLLVTQYAVLGSRTALLRLNLLFLPIVLLVILIVQGFTIRLVELDNLQPLFTSNWKDIFTGAKDVSLSFTGFEILLFYSMFMKKPADAPKAAIIGLLVPLVLYLMIYTLTIGVFSADVTKNLTYPTIELTKEVEVPGGIFERVESLFFTIWIMTIFNSTAMYLDVALLSLHSLFKRVRKITFVLIVSPVIYFLSMLPQNLVDFFKFGDRLTYFGFLVVYACPIAMLLIAIMRGVKGNE
ncbi:endospore germination permease [Paenibacillus sp. MBLB4367]|uniref:GerAB/ArcD/ProY family transporter n=1 Tax=Paenibacillus sp. MBLB4367 TaxID=3384767 RepID=UPI0039081311